MRKTVDFWIAVVLLVFCGIAAFLTNQVPDGGVGTKYGPSFFPWLMVLGIAALSVALLVKSIVKISSDTPPMKSTSKQVYAKMVLFLGLMFLYATFYIKAGYLISTVIFFMVAMLVLGERRPVHVVVVPAGIIVGIYLVFTKIMQVYLP